MKVIIDKAGTIFDHFIDILTIVDGVILILLVLYIGADVTVRKIVGISLPYVYDLSQVSLVFISYFVAAWTLREKGHVRMDLLIHSLKPKHASLTNMITSIISAIICLLITWFGTTAAINLAQRGVLIYGHIDIPKAPIVAVIPVCFFLLFIQSLRMSYDHLCKYRELRGSNQLERIK
jgi:C4-dicarboxylate transporter, DctQ subunit